MLCRVQVIELYRRRLGDKISPNGRVGLHKYKSINSHEVDISLEHIIPWDMHPQHFHVNANDLISSLLNAPNYASLLHVASLKRVAATCLCNMTPLLCPTLLFVDIFTNMIFVEHEVPGVLVWSFLV